jgi:alpha-tubulin suppressor-like RCC1 family protein
LNEEFKAMKDEDATNKTVVKIDSADEYSGALMKDGTFYVWGKNDRGQMGVGAGVGIDMVESENVPVIVNILDKFNKP